MELDIKIRSIDPGYFLTKGKRDEIKQFCDEHEIEQVIISEPLSPRQAGNLGELLDCNIFDRTELILEIFEKSAHSAEGKMQVAIAMLQHKKTRVAGSGLHMSQQSGHIGGKGRGSTEYCLCRGASSQRGALSHSIPNQPGWHVAFTPRRRPLFGRQ